MNTRDTGFTTRGLVTALATGLVLIGMLVIVSKVKGSGDGPATTPARATTAPRTPAPASTPVPPAATTPATTPPTTPAATTPAPSTTPTTPATTPSPAPTPAPAPNRGTTPAQAQANARNAVAQVEACATDTNDYARCDTAADLGNTGLAIANGTPRAGEVEIIGATNTFLLRAADSAGRLWGISRHAGSLQLTKLCQEADGVTPCAVPTW